MRDPVSTIARLRRLRVRNDPLPACGADIELVLRCTADARSARHAGHAAWAEAAPDELRGRVRSSEVIRRELVLSVESAAWLKRVSDWLRQGGEVALVRAGGGSYSRVRVVRVSIRRSE